MSHPNAAGVRRFRQRMAEAGWTRVELRLGQKFVALARAHADRRGMSFRRFVEEALVAYVATGNASKR